MMRPVLEILRLEETELYGTFGILKIQKEVFCVTLEPADRLNEVNISSIPAQQYLIKKTTSPRFGETYRVEDVPGRSAILFHPGNVAADTQGCIILGQYFDKLKGNRAVCNSGITFRSFMTIMASRQYGHLTIREVY